MRSTLALAEQPTARRFFNGADKCWHVQVTQGESYVTSSSQEVLTTVLGSCIAACLRDPAAGVGGMNHFLLAQGRGADQGAMRYGVNAMEILINGLLARGAMRERLQAKLFGGASVIAGLSDIGADNAAFARRYLEAEGIALTGGDTGGTQPRRIQYWPRTGRVRQLSVPALDAGRLITREREAAQTGKTESNDVELF